jgi:lysine-specific demethylase 8
MLQRVLVDVEISRIGRGYGDKGNDDEWFQTQMPFMMFHDAFIDGKLRFSENDPNKQKTGYVAQQDLFEVVPELKAHCPPLPHSLAGPRGDREQWRRNIWIGGAGTFTPIHRDPYENLFAQVVGAKRFHLFPPEARTHLHLSPGGPQSNTSTIPTEEVLLDLEGKADEAHRLDLEPLVESSFHAIVQPGDVLYVPQGWFHCVASLSVSASVNAWFR